MLFVVEGFADGGAEGKLCELVSRLDRSRFRPIVCSLGLGDARRKDFEALGVDIHTIPKRARWIDWALVRQLTALMRRERVDIVQTTLFYADVAGAWAAARAGIDNVLAWETVSSPKWLRWDRKLAYRFTQKWRRQVIAVSQRTAQYLVDERGIDSDRVQVIPYGVDLTRFTPGKSAGLRAELDLDPGARILVTVARLVDEKGHRFLIEAARSILETCPEAHFAFLGDGPLAEDIATRAKSLGIDDHIHLLGFRRDVSALLTSADIFVLPSLYEGLPNAVLEAMAAARPVVATAVDGTQEAVVDGETGLLVPPGDPDALVDPIVRLLQEPDTRTEMGIAGRARVEAEFSLEVQIERFESLYDSWTAR
ncbi:MAG: glycosyltransferase [Planctomycetota bacterium]